MLDKALQFSLKFHRHLYVYPPTNFPLLMSFHSVNCYLSTYDSFDPYDPYDSYDSFDTIPSASLW